ncbi:MAG TPA: SRPBCC family protein [Casimicrobiaceae bacterium]|nr:SRPBCC family protein [Casimicrobiaceae bacterium]
MREYALVTHWHLRAPIDRVWDAIYGVEDWPRWWRFVEAVVALQKGDANGVGAVRRFTWTSRLPYALTFEMRSSVVERPTFMEGTASGELTGLGRWRLAPEGESTRVRYEWTVVATKSWMNLLAPLLAPAFRWNHGQVMAEGGRGLARHLGVELLSAS